MQSSTVPQRRAHSYASCQEAEDLPGGLDPRHLTAPHQPQAEQTEAVHPPGSNVRAQKKTVPKDRRLTLLRLWTYQEAAAYFSMLTRAT